MMTHAHTFGGRLHITFTYYTPAVGRARGEKFAEVQNAVLEVSKTSCCCMLEALWTGLRNVS